MTREDLESIIRSYIKDHLRVEVETSYKDTVDCSYVKVYLDKELIYTSYDSIDVCKTLDF